MSRDNRFHDDLAYEQSQATIADLRKQLKLAEESKDCAWENNGILERARQKKMAEVAEVREILTHTVMGSLPNDWLLKDVAEARLHDMIGLRNQVRDTCVRAEKAEATIADLRERHESFVRKVRSEAQRAEDLAICTSLTSYLANEILALCNAELGKEQP